MHVRSTFAVAIPLVLSALALGCAPPPSAASPAAPPGSLQIQELVRLLFQAWRRGGAWDEARSDPEALRVGPENRDSSPVGVVREMVIEALQVLGEGRWVPWDALAGYLGCDAGDLAYGNKVQM